MALFYKRKQTNRIKSIQQCPFHGRFGWNTCRRIDCRTNRTHWCFLQRKRHGGETSKNEPRLQIHGNITPKPWIRPMVHGVKNSPSPCRCCLTRTTRRILGLSLFMLLFHQNSVPSMEPPGQVLWHVMRQTSVIIGFSAMKVLRHDMGRRFAYHGNGMQRPFFRYVRDIGISRLCHEYTSVRILLSQFVESHEPMFATLAIIIHPSTIRTQQIVYRRTAHLYSIKGIHHTTI